jgi:hypothetical protein
MNTQRLPINGEALAYATKEYVDQAYDRVREVLEWDPPTHGRSWPSGRTPPCSSPERKEFPAPIGEIRDIARIIITFPGSTAVERIADLIHY